SEWEIIQEIVDNRRKIRHEKRIIFNAILWILTTGSQWRNLESRFPPWQSVYHHFRHWKKAELIEELLDFLAFRLRVWAKRADSPSVLALDSQRVKIVQFTSEEKGIDGGKFINETGGWNGRKRHIAVDCLGIPWAVLVTAGNISDGAAGDILMGQLKGKSERLKTLKVDKGYKEGFVERTKEQYGWAVEIV
ncbi:MAG: IS5 family transposase, partial [Verrucomicrobia bacterium]|nr:IS5 family transposase [Cytophagales bacterium]